MLAIIFGISLFPFGVLLGIAVAVLAGLFVSGWIKLVLIYVAFLVLLWIFLWFDELLTYVFDTTIAKLTGMPASPTKTGYNPGVSLRRWLLAGVCIGFALSSIWAPSDILNWLRAIHSAF